MLAIPPKSGRIMKPKSVDGVNSRYFRRWVPVLIIVLITMVFTTSAYAEFYRYVDEHGNVMYTDDLSNVPPDQRDKVRPYEESESEPPPVEPKKAESPETGKADMTSELEKERQRLQEQEKALNQEYEDLMKMRSQLNEEKGTAVTNAQIKAYNQQIIDFNRRIQAYEKKRDALANEVKTFNKKVEENSNQGEKQ